MLSDTNTAARWRLLAREPEFAIAQLILWLFVAFTALQVTMRFVFNAPLTWPEELSQILLVWMTFIAAIGLSRQQMHIRVELLDQFMGQRARQFLEGLFNLLTIAFMAYLVVGGWQMFQEMQFERTPALRIKLNLVFAIVPLSAAFMAIIHFRQFISNLAAVFRT